MIQREAYMKQIRPFIGGDLIKVLTGIRRSGKSVMLQLIQQELRGAGVDPSRFLSLNFERLENAALCTAEALHREVLHRAASAGGRVYLFLDELRLQIA